MYLGIDLGTTGLKCVMYDKDGTVLSEYNEEYPLIFIGSFVEQDANLWWEKICEAVRGLSAECGGEVKALSISTQGISFVPVDENGNTLYNSINWLDMRAGDECSELAARFGEAVIFKKTGKLCDASYSLPKIMWFKKHRSEIWNKTYKILFPLDYLNMKLTGKFVTDYTIAGGTMLYNIRDLCWDREIMEYCGIDENILPDVVPMGTDIGKILPEVAEAFGISSECHVIMGAQDQKVAAIGAGLNEEVCTMSFGTATAVTKMQKCALDRSEVCQFRFDDNYYVSEGVAETSGAALKWLSHMMGDISYKEMDVLAETSVAGANGVTMETQFSVGASMSGMTLSTTKGDLIYALYEGVCRETALRIKQMGGANEIRVFGGGSKSRIWCDILARITGCRVCILDTPETASRGAAILASKGEMAPAKIKYIIEPC
ncbi:MAG: hypothetical protein E7660_00055 [Ruminococcaceae bacterium]|nr:hypothetical protein [Oscillospiraceae bacterium]